jgi:hypothetical protein
VDAIDFWKLCSEYTVVQAALLTSGHDPGVHQDDVERNAKKPHGYVAVRSALTNAIYSGRLNASKVHYTNDYEQEGELNPHATTIAVEDLRDFLKSAGYASSFFDRPTAAGDRTSLIPYPPKLEAANKAWAAVSENPALLIGRSPKQALEKWLTEHAAEFQLLNRDGKVNRTGIEEICKVANWKPSGGATPTPSLSPKPVAPPASPLTRLPTPPPATSPKGPRVDYDLNDDIPF